MQTYAYGFPRIGKAREFKKATEHYWEKKITDKELIAALHNIEAERLAAYKRFVNVFPLSETTHYDIILDHALMFGVYPVRNLDEYFEYARGKKALELKKYFNTNYHYLVPHIKKNTRFSLSWNKPLEAYRQFSDFAGNPVFLIGPYTFLKLSKVEDFDGSLAKLCDVYRHLFEILVKEGVNAVHLEEPAFCADVSARDIRQIARCYRSMIPLQLKVDLMTYYDSVDFLSTLYDLPLTGIGINCLHDRQVLDMVSKKGFPSHKKLICGVIDARTPLRADIFSKVKLIEKIRKVAKLKKENILVSNTSPLFHLPITIDLEAALQPALKNTLSFAREKLYELKLIQEVFAGRLALAQTWSKGIKAIRASSRCAPRTTLSKPPLEFDRRKKIQRDILGLPLLPTTTIGSFPQDKEIRKARFQFAQAAQSMDDYESFMRNKMLDLINREEEFGLDVLVHGEFERSDMVEFFAQKLDGFLTTSHGWVVSYGTRVYRPPLITGLIKRTRSLVLKETYFAQRLTPKPVKAILTGPLTILAWSYNIRNETPWQLAKELACAFHQEALELIHHGVKIIQIDEPAIKEMAPLKKRDQDAYYTWAVHSFNTIADLPPEVQVHTHLCYSEFKEALKWIMKMNFDVLSIEAAREHCRIVDELREAKFDRAVGPGVWDIHSKYPASLNSMKRIVEKSIRAFGVENVWVNPDCGLKTRSWHEVECSLRRMVQAARALRKKYGKQKTSPLRKRL